MGYHVSEGALMSDPVSQQAQAVLNAVFDACELPVFDQCTWTDIEPLAAAALRTAVRQVQFRQSGDHYVCDSADLVAIIEELEERQ